MAAAKNKTTYILRLTAFATVSVLVGIVVLILCFAPATNPGFLSSVLFRGNNQSDIRELKKVALMFCGPKSPSVAIYEKLERPLSPDDFKRLGLESPETVAFRSADGVALEGWYFKGPGADTALVCYNGFGKRLPLEVGYIKMLREAGLSVLLFDYRGLDDKSVKVSPQTACLDGQAAFDYLVREKKVAPEQIILLGRDLGSYVCLKIAAANKCKALILENPWATVKGFVEAVPGAVAMRLVPGWLYTDDCLNNVHLAGEHHPPILVVSDDPEMTDSDRFLASIAGPKSFLYVEEYMPVMLAPDLERGGAKYSQMVKSIVAGEALVTAQAASIDWKSDYSSALDLAGKSNKPLLVEFGAPWCVFCRKMDRITYVDGEVAARINKDFVPVRLDTSSKDAQALMARYPFSGIPTVLVLDCQGNLKGKLTGFLSPSAFLTKLSAIK